MKVGGISGIAQVIMTNISQVIITSIALAIITLLIMVLSVKMENYVYGNIALIITVINHKKIPQYNLLGVVSGIAREIIILLRVILLIAIKNYIYENTVAHPFYKL